MSLFLLLVACHGDVVDSASSSCADAELAASVGPDDSGTAVTASVGGNEAYTYAVAALDTAIVAEANTRTDPQEDDGCSDCPTSPHIVFEAVGAGSTDVGVEVVADDDSVTETLTLPLTVD